MSIVLRVELYCENCPHFEPESETDIITQNDWNYNPIEIGITQVYCVNRHKCDKIYDYLKSQMKKEQTDD